MPLEDAYFISQIIAAVAIVASLIFVGLQLRYSARAHRAVIEQGRADRSTAMFSAWIEPQHAALIERIAAGDPSLTSTELYRAQFIFRTAMINFEEAMLQQKAGFMHDAAWATTKAAMQSYLRNPGFQALWAMLRPTYSAELTAAVESLIDRTSLSQQSDLTQHWRNAVESVQNSVPPRE